MNNTVAYVGVLGIAFLIACQDEEIMAVEIQVKEFSRRQASVENNSYVFAIMEAVSKYASKGDDTIDYERSYIVAWCLKGMEFHLPTQIVEEVICLTRWGKTSEWSLVYLMRTTTSPDYTWTEGVNVAGYECLKWNSRFKDKPSQQDTIEFVRNTNFGINEFENFDDPIKVYTIILYAAKMKGLKEVLGKGISDKAKSKRRAIYLRSLGGVFSRDIENK